MSRGINSHTIVGNLGVDPEERFTPSGTQVVSFTVATGETWIDKPTGERKERTDWHNVTTFGKLAEIASKYLTKGSQVYVQGPSRTRQYKDKHSGETKYFTSIVCKELQMLGTKGAGTDDEPISNNDDVAQFDGDLPL